MLRAFSISLVLTALMWGCAKPSKKVTWMYYEETYCADRWTYTNSNERLKENARAYLASKGVTVYEMEIFLHAEPEACKACTCKTGRRYKMKVKSSDVEDAKREGLYE